MLTDADFLPDVKPLQPSDRDVVRPIDGPARLERIMRQLPSHWRLEHVTSVGNGMLVCVFSRDPAKARPGDFDYVAPSNPAMA